MKALVLLAVMTATLSQAFALPRTEHAALGLSAGFQNRSDYGSGVYAQPMIEAVALGYERLSGELWIRPGLRAGFAWAQPEMPTAVQIRNYDLKVGVEAALAMNWLVVPSFSVGGGAILRRTSLVTAEPVGDGEDLISGFSVYPVLSAQAGLGFPFVQGKYVLEPFARFTNAFGDPRIGWAYGADLTISLY